MLIRITYVCKHVDVVVQAGCWSRWLDVASSLAGIDSTFSAAITHILYRFGCPSHSWLNLTAVLCAIDYYTSCRKLCLPCKLFGLSWEIHWSPGTWNSTLNLLHASHASIFLCDSRLPISFWSITWSFYHLTIKPWYPLLLYCHFIVSTSCGCWL